jgi:hypothetical protein
VAKHLAAPRGRQVRRRGGVAGPVTVLIVAIATLATFVIVNSGIFSSGRPTSRGAEAPDSRAPPRVEDGQAPPRSASTVLAVPTFRVGVQGWRALPGTLFTRGQLGEPTATYARIQRDPSTRPAIDPATGAAMVGVTTRVLSAAEPGMRLRATVQVRASGPGVTVVVRLSEWDGGRRVERGEGRLTLRDTGWRQAGADHRVGGGSAIDLEIWAPALGQDQALYVDRPVVTSE